ncbi:uncharacterized protein LAESUDRAFT_764851 [Laetiporus sulphureus 93-53]|uniref:Uncharacterized protein n=1 Tax=Laetiporus sulphureus 93-53 TaxID=1314785 RepID=A0A165B3J9_9APHY|nr:uncharacterized protein LAESUDRAFT_764851 [Laetiporus sulphureus 93-53]KZT00158.1 hypothetical protein LAESUDRAFT_764851 [Laetiporus sulphureus 93-53]
MSHVDGVFSLAAHTRSVYPIDGACILLLQHLDNLVFTSPTPDAHALVWQGWATSFFTYELCMTRDYPDHAKSLLHEVNSVYDWLMLNASPDFDWIPAVVPSTLRGYSEAVGTADLICSPAAMTEIMQEIIEAADRGDFDKFPEELISPERAAAFSANKELSPPPVTEASAHTPSNTGEVVASNSLTASNGTNDTLLSVALASFSVVAMPVTASAALGDPVPTFEFQARVANPVAIDPPFDSDLAAMEVDPLLTFDNSDSDEVKFMGGTIPNLSPVHPKKGKGCGRKSIKASKITTTSEDQVSSSLAEAVYRLLVLLLPSACKWWMRDTVPDIDDADRWLSLKKLYHQKDWQLPKMLDASVIVKASSHQGDYDEQMCDVNTASSDYTTELELLLDTLIDEYETVIAPAPCLHRPPSFLIMFLAN